jgi:ribosomal subunit interface protein
MNIQTRFKKAKISPSLKSYLQEKTDKFEKFLPKDAVLEIELRSETRSKKGKNKVMNLTVDIPGEKVIHVAKASYDFRSIIDITTGKLLKILERKHSKRIRYEKRGSLLSNAINVAGFIPKMFSKRIKAEQKLTRKNLYSGKAIYPEQAIEVFKNQKEPFILFKNIENNKISIVSKNKNKTIIYTIIQ